jgi:hypothetical protein
MSRKLSNMSIAEVKPRHHISAAQTHPSGPKMRPMREIFGPGQVGRAGLAMPRLAHRRLSRRDEVGEGRREK